MKHMKALQWLIEQVHSDEYTHAFGKTYISIDLVEQALKMQNQQLKDAYAMGWLTREHKPINTEARHADYADRYIKDIYEP